jgi:hypothetical protein
VANSSEVRPSKAKVGPQATLHPHERKSFLARVIIVPKNLVQTSLARSAALGGKLCRAEQQFFAGKIEGVFLGTIITRVVYNYPSQKTTSPVKWMIAVA